jgi:CDP-glucose 4,6-dehydratase
VFYIDKKCIGSFNFGTDKIMTVEEITKKVINLYGKTEIIYKEENEIHEANLLMLNTDKAKNILGWYPLYTIDEAIERTVDWYNQYYENSNYIRGHSIGEIEDYEERIKNELKR